MTTLTAPEGKQQEWQPQHGAAGRAAIASGALGVIAFGLLITFLGKRLAGGTEQATVPVIRAHDLAALLQFLLLMPLVAAIGTMARPVMPARGQRSTPLLRAMGIASLLLVAVCLALIFTKRVPDDLYMIPLGAFGLWMVSANRRMASVLPRRLTRLGVVAGVGLALVGSFPLAFTLFVDHAHWRGWTPYDYQAPAGTDVANAISHLVLVIGTFTGLTTVPIWSTLVGRRLLRPTLS